jgi:plasmid stability protein
MASITIRNLDDSVKQALRIRAAIKGVSMEEEARAVLTTEFAPQLPTRKHTAEEVQAWLDAMPKPAPANPKIAALDQKTLSDMISDGLL